LTNYKSRTK